MCSGIGISLWFKIAFPCAPFICLFIGSSFVIYLLSFSIFVWDAFIKNVHIQSFYLLNTLTFYEHQPDLNAVADWSKASQGNFGPHTNPTF